MFVEHLADTDDGTDQMDQMILEASEAAAKVEAAAAAKRAAEEAEEAESEAERLAVLEKERDSALPTKKGGRKKGATEDPEAVSAGQRGSARRDSSEKTDKGGEKPPKGDKAIAPQKPPAAPEGAELKMAGEQETTGPVEPQTNPSGDGTC